MQRARARSLATCWLTVFQLLVFVAAGGCDRTSELAKQESSRVPAGKFVTADAAHVEPAAVKWLERCAAAYARLDAYEDAGRVVLTYKVDGATTHDVAPLAVAFQSPNRLGMKAYQVLAGPTESRFRLRVESSKAGTPLATQVISRTLPAKLDMTWLMSDEIAVEHLAAGLAGSPPQLELLLGQQPFRALLDGASSVALDGQGKEDGQAFQIIKIARGSANYRLWIESDTGLLRRIELPTVALPPAMLTDAHISDIRLSIELDKPRLGQRIDWSKWQVPVSPLDKLVRYLVAPPVDATDQRLGRGLPAFRLQSIDGQSTIDTSARAGEGKIQILVWLADHPSCRATLDQIRSALEQLPATSRDNIACLAVWAEAAPPAGMTFDELKSQWSIDMPLVQDDGSIGRDVLSLAEAPAVVVLDSKHRLQWIQERANPLLSQALPNVLVRLAGGEHLAGQLAEKLQWQRERFQAQLWMARASDANAGAFTRPNSYPPALMQLETIETKPIDQQVVAFVSDTMQSLWLLTVDGRLTKFDQRGRLQSSLDTHWDLKSDSQNSSSRLLTAVRLSIDESAHYLAATGGPLNGIQVIDLSSGSGSVVSLDNQSLIDMRWLGTPAGVRLAAITTAGRTLLIDPQQSQQHSGQCAAEPMAIVPRAAPEPLTSGYVILIDGRIEPVIVQDEGGATRAALARPVSANVASDANNTKEKSVGGLPSPSGMLRQLQFTPASGPWSQLRDDQSALTLARGMLASDEPAVFVLDTQLHQLWHAPLPLEPGPAQFLSCAAKDPQSGQPLWLVSSGDATLHFFRADGQLVDHCQLQASVRGLALVLEGQSLRLWIAHDRQLVQVKLKH